MPQRPEHRVISGFFQPQLEQALVSQIEVLKRGDPLSPCLLLVGSNLLGLHLTRLVARQLGSVAGMRTVTFLDLARILAAPTVSASSLRDLPKMGERLLARNLADAL
ncbi:MAG TPA: hypothetical protein VGA64_08650, partial [Candidatus Polarisedimenticolia bacterium]